MMGSGRQPLGWRCVPAKPGPGDMAVPDGARSHLNVLHFDSVIYRGHEAYAGALYSLLLGVPIWGSFDSFSWLCCSRRDGAAHGAFECCNGCGSRAWGW